MQPAWSDIIITPLTAGTVGYVTNWLAIKMLFRPHRPRWYSFGWVGIIPRTRHMLSRNVADMVGSRLFTPEDIAKAFESDRFRTALNNAVSHFTETVMHRDESIGHLAERAGFPLEMLTDALQNILQQDSVRRALTDTAAALLAGYSEEAIQRPLSAFPAAPRILKEGGDRLIAENRWRTPLALYLQNTLLGTVRSGKSIQELFPALTDDVLDRLAAPLADAGISLMADAVQTDEARDFFARQTVKMKDALIPSDGFFGALKKGMMDMVVSDATIMNAVSKQIPELSENLRTNSEVRKAVQRTITTKLKELSRTPLSALLAEKGIDANTICGTAAHALTAAIHTDALRRSLAEGIDSFCTRNADLPMATLLEQAGITAETRSGLYSTAAHRLLSSGATAPAAAALVQHLGGTPLSRITAQFTPQQVDRLNRTVAEKAQSALRIHLPAFLASVDVPGTVKARIDALDLNEVEHLLFSFMSEHFQWINILGFIIGALVGILEVALRAAL